MHIFVSHTLAYNEKERETTFYNCDEFIQTLDTRNHCRIELPCVESSLSIRRLERVPTSEKSDENRFHRREDHHSQLRQSVVSALQSEPPRLQS